MVNNNSHTCYLPQPSPHLPLGHRNLNQSHYTPEILDFSPPRTHDPLRSRARASPLITEPERKETKIVSLRLSGQPLIISKEDRYSHWSQRNTHHRPILDIVPSSYPKILETHTSHLTLRQSLDKLYAWYNLSQHAHLYLLDTLSSTHAQLQRCHSSTTFPTST